MHHLCHSRPGRACFLEVARFIRNCGLRRRHRSRNIGTQSNIWANRKAILDLRATSRRISRNQAFPLAPAPLAALPIEGSPTLTLHGKRRWLTSDEIPAQCGRRATAAGGTGLLPRSEVRASSFPFLLDSGNISVDATDNAEPKATAFRLSRIEVKKAKPSMVNLSRRRTIIGRVCFFAHVAAAANSAADVERRVRNRLSRQSRRAGLFSECGDRLARAAPQRGMAVARDVSLPAARPAPAFSTAKPFPAATQRR